MGLNSIDVCKCGFRGDPIELNEHFKSVRNAGENVGEGYNHQYDPIETANVKKKKHIYVTSKNSGPSYGPDPVYVIYIGDDLTKAEEAVGDFRRYLKYDINIPGGDALKPHHTYHALPQDTEVEIIKYYMADGWWYSIVKLEV